MTADPLFLPHASSQAELAQLTIFVSIVSYRDSQTLPTLHSLYSQADHPARIHAGIVWQYNPGIDQNLFLFSSPSVPSCNLRQLFLHHTAAHGPMHARHLCERLYGGQHCYLQLDSHMRFTPHWDTLLLDALYTAAFLPSSPSSPPPCTARRCLITGYPSDYAVDSPPSSALSPTLSIMAASHFAPDGLLRIKARPLLPCPSPPTSSSLLPSYFVAAGFLFTSAALLRLMPTPSHADFPSLFFGEELLLSLRAFSFGFDCFHPPQPVVAHCWSRQYRPSWREVQQQQGAEHDDGEGARRVISVMRGDAGQHWLGKERTVQQYWGWLGIDWQQQQISERAKRGGVEAERLQQPAADGSAVVNPELMQRILAFVHTAKT